jgi:hypothetical protein
VTYVRGTFYICFFLYQGYDISVLGEAHCTCSRVNHMHTRSAADALEDTPCGSLLSPAHPPQCCTSHCGARDWQTGVIHECIKAVDAAVEVVDQRSVDVQDHGTVHSELVSRFVMDCVRSAG